MDSLISKGERLLPVMFSGDMRRIRLATSDGELWGYAGKIGERADRGLTPAGWHVYALMGKPDGNGTAMLMADCVVDHLLDVALPIDLGDRPLMDVGEWEYVDVT
ncbi:hypothetical protein [Bifidobacterium pseudocatenulatum]|uniref:hypothetical protein n=1 Tax=Bifidobacterium pseudocatenulatum TaxID=28026 RepID=UPI001D00E313|nr:hypothetical protein [Bifidobacterium pseudocatenulatum]UDG85835.1 hypothetical protein KYE72_05890 [Bifidobacterium pseudocatenulatum]